MSKRIDFAAAATVGAFLVMLGLSAFASRLASTRAGEYFAARALAGGTAAEAADWTPVRDGAVLGRLSRGNRTYYLVSFTPAGGHLDALVAVDRDGAPTAASIIGSSPATPYMQRLGAVVGSLGRARDGSASSLDGSIAPRVEAVMDTLAALERERAEAVDAAR